MKETNNMNLDDINELYYRWLNEKNPIEKAKLKEEIKHTVSVQDFLTYSVNNSMIPLKKFRNIFSLKDLFIVLEQMKKQGKDITPYTQTAILVTTPEDIMHVSSLSKNSSALDDDLCFIFNGSMVFENADVKSIGEHYPSSYVNSIGLDQIEQLMAQGKNCKGLPITITIDNIGELPLEKLEKIEQFFDVEGVRILEKEKASSKRY